MTLLDTPPPTTTTTAVERRESGPTALRPAPLRLAARLARREVRRRPGRTALVAALVALPVFAMTVALVLAQSARDNPQAEFARSWGDTDLMVQWGSTGDAIPTTDDIRPLLPAGATVTSYLQTYPRLTRADGRLTGYVDFRVAPAAVNVADRPVEVTAGRLPGASGEILLSPDLADDLAVGVGDTLTLARPSGDWAVVGIGRLASDRRAALAQVAELPAERLRPEAVNLVSLVDLPDLAPSDLARELTAMYERTVEAADDADATSTYPSWWRLAPRVEHELETATDVDPTFGNLGMYGWSDGPPIGANELAWGWIAGVLALAAVGVVIAAAFASSARRQLATIGQLSANGASQRLVSATLALQGAWTGLVGTVIGMGAALALVPLSRPLLEYVVGHGIGPWRFHLAALAVIAATGVVAATLAALVPARSAARIPVLAALAGRRPLAAVPRQLVPIGLALFGSGTMVLALVTLASGNSDGGDGNLVAAMAVLGGLAVLAGMCCASPVAVDLVGRAGSRLAGTKRLAARSVARSRTRSAGVLTAIAVTGAAAIAITTAVGSVAFDEAETPHIPSDTVIAQAEWNWTDGDLLPPSERPQLDPAIVNRVRAIVPGASESIRHLAVADLTDEQAQMYGQPSFLVADGATLAMLGLSDRDHATLDEIGAMVLWAGSSAVDEQTFSIWAPTADGSMTEFPAAVPRDPLSSRAGGWGEVVTPAFAAAHGMEVVDAGVVFTSPAPLTADQRAALSEMQGDLWTQMSDPFIEAGDASVAAPGPGDPGYVPSVYLDYHSPSSAPPRALVDAIALGVALVMTLIVVAIGLSLSATESRDERDVLVAVGSPPRTMRRLAGLKAVVLTVGAAALAIPTGFVPIAAVLAAAPEDNDIVFPWLTALGLLVVIPAVAGLAALATSTIAQRLRPVHMSTLAAD